MSVCGNFVELIEAQKVKNEKDFLIWSTNLIEIDGKELLFDVYIENKIVDELSQHELVLIDAATGKINGEDAGMLFIKANHNKYGI